MKKAILHFMRFIFIIALFYDLAYGQDTIPKKVPNRYAKVAISSFLRIETEWKKSERKSHNLALNVYLNQDFYNGFKLEASNRNYYGKKHRRFWSYHAGIGYIERITQYMYTEKVIYTGPPDVIFQTEEIQFRKHKWITAGIGTGIGWQRTLGKKKRWLAEGSLGIQYYYYYYREPKSEKSTLANGATLEKKWETNELVDLWERTPWEGLRNKGLFVFRGSGTPFHLLYLNVMVGHNF